jgi:hypothetical protein
MKTAMGGAVPRWALVLLSGIACYFLIELVKEMRIDHELVRGHQLAIITMQRTLDSVVETQQKQAITQAQLTTLIDAHRRQYQ